MPPVREENMLIEQVMHDNPETLTPEHLLKDALQVYERHGVNCVPILDANQKVRGILTVFRLLHAIREGWSFDTPIGEVMDVNLVSIRKAEQAVLLAYPWPGNVRELGNFVERLTIAHLSFNSCAPVWQSIAVGAGQTAALPPVVAATVAAPPLSASPQSMREQVKDFERHCLEQALRTVPGIRAAARYLQISHATLLRKMREHGLEQ